MALLSLSDFERDALETLSEFGAIPALSPMFDADWEDHGYLEQAAQLLAAWARKRQLANFDVEIHRLKGRTPTLVVTVESTSGPGGTVVLYGHLDKQPPLGNWSDGLDPFVPVRRGDRLYARGVSDDGYAIFSALSALEAMEVNGLPHGRCVVLIEASEESGSPDLEAYLDALAEQLGAVELLICLDSGALTYDRLWVTSSLRGVLNVEVTVEVLAQGQHSGSVSGIVPSSFRILRQLLDRLEDADSGDILVQEMHADIPIAHVKSAHDIAEEFGDVIARELPTLPGVALMGASAEERLLRRTWYPTLSVIGMGGIPTPDIAGNVLRPYTAFKLSLRTPPLVDGNVAAMMLKALLEDNAPYNAKVTFNADGRVGAAGATGWNAPALAPWLQLALDAASNAHFGAPCGYVGQGGTIPLMSMLQKSFPKAQMMVCGVLGPKSNAHGPNEFLHLPTARALTAAVGHVIDAHARRAAGD